MTNNHCDYVSIELAWNLMYKLKLKKGEFARMCEVSTQQLRNWENKGRMPAIRFAAVENALRKEVSDELQKRISLINSIFE